MLSVEVGLVVWALMIVLTVVVAFFVVRFFVRLGRKVDRLSENQGGTGSGE
jgi:hypothetical protein